MVTYGRGWNLSTDGGPGFWGAPFARAGLDILFSISGYMGAGSRLRTPHLPAFLTKRALRIMPGLAACVVLTTFVLGARLTSLPLAAYLTSHSTLKYLANIVFHSELYLPGVFTGLREPGAVNGSLWSLFPEAPCYLTVPFAFLSWHLVEGPALRWRRQHGLQPLAADRTGASATPGPSGTAIKLENQTT